MLLASALDRPLFGLKWDLGHLGWQQKETLFLFEKIQHHLINNLNRITVTWREFRLFVDAHHDTIKEYGTEEYSTIVGQDIDVARSFANDLNRVYKIHAKPHTGIS